MHLIIKNLSKQDCAIGISAQNGFYIYRIEKQSAFILSHEDGQVCLDRDMKIIGKCEDLDLRSYHALLS